MGEVFQSAMLGVFLVLPVLLAVPLSNTLTTTQDPPGVLLVAVVTAPQHERARRAIRDTWVATAKAATLPMDIRFFIGWPEDTNLESIIHSEQETYGDIIRLAVTEKYENLGTKTLETVSWAYDHGYYRVVKVDDDTYLNVPALEKFLQESAPTDRLYAGQFKDGGLVIDDPSSKWYMRDQYPHETFPRYAFGPCYFLGQEMVHHIATNKGKLPAYRVEDAGVALWTEGLALNTVNMPNLLNSAYCTDAPPQPVFVTPVNAQEMAVIHDNVQRGDVCGSDRSNPYVLEECRTNRCRCWPPPEGNCENFANGEYVDVIPRL